MADHPLFFDELLRTPNLRARAYIVVEPPGIGMACVELSARRLEDWFFARRWVSVRAGRRLLYWLLDEVESQRFRFRIARTPRVPESRPSDTEPWTLAQVAWNDLSEEERRIHRELFPHEVGLLGRGYDWDHEGVYQGGQPLPRDALGRWVEEEGGVVYEWVKVTDEWTWRRFPLYQSAPPVGAPPSAVEASG